MNVLVRTTLLALIPISVARRSCIFAKMAAHKHSAFFKVQAPTQKKEAA